MPTRRPLSLAFLGCGFITALHSKTLARCRRDVSRFCAGRDSSRAEAFNRKYRGNGFFGSYEAAIADVYVDAVLIATPPAQHLDLALAAMQAGKDVIVEKPPFLTSTDFRTARDVHEQTGRRLLVAENDFYKPLARRLRDLVAADVVGDVLLVQVNALHNQRTSGWRDDPDQIGGGVLFEGGIHWVNLLSNLGMTVTAVRGYRPSTPEGLDRTIIVALEYAEGAIATLSYSWEVPVFWRGLSWSRIVGRKGTIVFESNGLMILINGTRKRGLMPGLSDIAGYRGMFREFIHALRTGEDSLLTLDAAERDLRLVEEAYGTAGRE